ncbi:outer membrane beta-barrel protein [Hydrogenophaga taeniospiralis]|uniref:outer membrane beta-barrel protein n=1 Tax=Hydrogenophaga taeniospiralis TaxID=65656 RepID=UPI001CFBB58F|nr:outer membrane beta-barrel protein [Hydrogenophaga taeniospiralis]UCU92308.1 hypothetical protein KI616_15790 [Hydrogenophaga taeniospiralis]
MKISRFLAVPAMMAMSSLVMAGGMDGLALEAGVSYASAQTTLNDYSPDGKVGDTNTGVNLSVNYSKSFGAFNLAGGVFSILGSQKSGSLQSFAEDTGGEWSDSFKLKNVWGISIQPGFNINDTTLFYTKLSYVQASGENNYNYVVDSDSGSASRKHNGVGFGVGVKFKILASLYGMVEVEQIKFNKKSYYSDVVETYKPSMVRGTVGIGYQF